MNGARGTFDGFVSREGQIPDAELDAFWAVLAPASINFMIGEWKGGAFDTGHPVSGLLHKANWFGKTMLSPSDVLPIVCLDDAGNKFNNDKLSKGGASLWLEEFRGEVTATMVYDGQPIHDHFKKVDDNTVMGIMNGKAGLQDGRYGYFYLQRV
ncbi:hypothetical protein BVU76_17920 [Mycolicibacterium porcinum]|nr:hypothetical protein BVU76_17920 [Mycolicibacterium porcinum]